MNSGFQRQALAIVALAAMAGCATTAPRHVVQSREPLQRIELPQPTSNQDPMTLALAGEFALANADLDGAVASYVKAAQASDDPAIAMQATHVALAGKHWDAAQTAYQRWQTLQPNDPGLWQAHAMLAGTAVKPPQLDEFFCTNEAHLRAAELAELGLSEAAIWDESSAR